MKLTKFLPRIYSLERRIFKNSSTSFYLAAFLFPKEAREDVFDLYSFLRVADDYVDTLPARTDELQDLISRWDVAKGDKEFDVSRAKNDTLNQRVIKNIVHLSRKYDFETVWVDKFLKTMESDLAFQPKQTLSRSLAYTEGSAAIVGLMMSRILGLSERLDYEARALGRAFQWINFVRDVGQDVYMGRCYFPENDLKNFKLADLSEKSAYANQTLFKDFMIFQIQRYEEWLDEAKKVLHRIPRRQRLPLEVAIDLYNWTAKEIGKDPHAVYTKKIKPSKVRIIFFVFKRAARV